jgi:hypothetical protein
MPADEADEIDDGGDKREGAELFSRAIRDEYEALFGATFRTAAGAGTEADVMLRALREVYSLAREHPEWSEEQVLRDALRAALESVGK